MQESDSTDSQSEQPKESAELTRLREEYDRLTTKRADATDPDIISVLDMRIVEIRDTLSNSDTGLEEGEEEPPESEEVQKLRAELAKLQDKRAKTKDKNIIAVLDMRIMQIQPTLPPERKPKGPSKAELKAEEAALEEEAIAAIPLPTPEESARAEQLIRQSMLEKRRGNVVGATDLMKKAADAAPGSSVVLEALGDDLLERKLMKQARTTYKRALSIDPKNVGLERKYAQTVLQSTTTMSVEDQLRYGMSDSLFITGDDHVAGLTAAKWLTGIVPGVGQMVLGRTKKGIAIFVAWFVFVGFFALWNQDFKVLSLFIRRGMSGPSPSGRVLFPIIGLAVVWIIAMFDLFALKGGGGVRPSKIERPKPPVDLPFE